MRGGLVPISQYSLETGVSVSGLRHWTVRVLIPHPHDVEHWIDNELNNVKRDKGRIIPDSDVRIAIYR